MQKHGSKDFACRPLPALSPIPLTLWLGLKGPNSTFLEHGHVAYQINVNHEGSSMVANILPAYPPPPPPALGMGSVGQNSTFSEYGHVAYQS